MDFMPLLWFFREDAGNNISGNRYRHQLCLLSPKGRPTFHPPGGKNGVQFSLLTAFLIWWGMSLLCCERGKGKWPTLWWLCTIKKNERTKRPPPQSTLYRNNQPGLFPLTAFSRGWKSGACADKEWWVHTKLNWLKGPGAKRQMWGSFLLWPTTPIFIAWRGAEIHYETGPFKTVSSDDSEHPCRMGKVGFLWQSTALASHSVLTISRTTFSFPISILGKILRACMSYRYLDNYAIQHYGGLKQSS